MIRDVRDRLLLGIGIVRGQLGQAEVEHLDRAVGPDHHVGGLEIAVNDAARMRGGQRVGHRDRDAQHLARGASPAAE